MIGLVDYDTAAVGQRIWDALIAPALCQTPEYAAAIIAGVERGIDPPELQRRVDARLRRQAVLAREDPQELRHLVEMASRPNVTLQVVPADAGAHPGIVGWFTLLEFPDGTADIGYTDGPEGSIHLEDAEDVRPCTHVSGQLTATARPVEKSITMIARLAQESQ